MTQPDPNTPTLDSSAEEQGISLSLTERLQKLLIIVGAVLVGGALLTAGIATVTTFSQEATWVSGQGELISYPVEGEYITIKDVKTHWQLIDGRFCPVSEISIGKGAKSGRLRLNYVNGQEESAGKTQAVDFSEGKFADGKVYIYHGTRGFETEGELQGYLTDQVDTWHLRVQEAAPNASEAVEFSDLVRIPIARQL